MFFFRTARFAAVVLTVAISPAAAQVTVLDFEDLPAGTTVTTQYGDRGLLLLGSFLDVDPAARSGTRILRSDNLISEFNPGPMVLEFTSGQTRVRMFAGLSGTVVSNDTLDGTLRAFDGNGALIAQDGPKPVVLSTFTTAFEVASATPAIRRLELEIGTSAFEGIDDLEFEGEAPPPPPIDTPVVDITFPQDGAELDGSPIMVTGTVSGEALFPFATLRMKMGLPPDSTALPLSASMPLTGTGTTRSFSLNLGLGIGPHLITVEARNTASLSGSDTARIVNLPEAIRQRFAAEGGAATFGELSYGGTGGGGCRIAVYEQGAIAAVGTATFVVRGEIFDKWFSLRDQGAAIARSGCPTSEERGALGGSLAQDFAKGRIYAGLPTGAHFVPKVFVDAIEQLGGEAGTGVPIMDPIDSIGVMQTWLFQRFTRPDQPHLLPSTLEIRGDPPVLWVERQGGDLSVLFLDEPFAHPTVPTLWLRFPCDGFLGPCPVVPPTSSPPVEDAGNRFCDGTTYPWGPPEWSAIEGDHVLTPLLGIVNASHKAGQDNPLTHENFSDVGDAFASDWNVSVRPLPPFGNLVAENTYVEVEFEVYFANAFFVQFDEPFRNDLFFAGGRWIIDCGHTPYRTEIHPPFVTAHMSTQVFSGNRSTEATIWVNGFYTGEPVSFDIFPPPRPSADSLLTVNKPIDANAEFNVDSEFSILDSNHVQIRFSASPRTVEVTDAGEMKWESGRAYTGRWYLFWSGE